MNSPARINFDYPILISTVSLIVIGILFIFSSGINAEGIQTSNEYLRQLIFASIGVALLIGVSMVKYDYYREFAVYIYLGFLALIVFTLLFGSVINGARSWIGLGPFGIQPSEFMKLAVILVLAHYLDKTDGRQIRSLRSFLIALLIIALPMGLILLQPDLGTAMVYLPIALFLLFAAGARPLYLMFVIGVLLLTIFFTVLPEWEILIYQGDIDFFVIFNERFYIILVLVSLALSFTIALVGYLILKQAYLFYTAYAFFMIITAFLLALGARWFLRDFQMMRLIVFLDPYVDPRGAGWNVIQSLTAVGSGGFSGMGYLRGTQSHYQYLPEQSTDFIFSILSEEWGFIGGIAIAALYLVIIIRGMLIANQARDKYGAYLSLGVVALLFFHFTINVGMTIGLMPITGIPLLFLSYGGSSLWTAMISVGVLMSVSHHRFKY